MFAIHAFRLASFVASAALAVPSLALAANDPGTGLPIYPGASKLAYQRAEPFDICGHREIVTVYNVRGAQLASLVGWYRRALPGIPPIFSHTPVDRSNHDAQTSGATFLTGGGANGVVLVQTTYGTTFRSTNSTIRELENKMLAVGISFERFSPPVDTDFLTGKRGCPSK
jgi:hypothetical protein